MVNLIRLEGTECRHWTRSPRRSSGSSRRSRASIHSVRSLPASSVNWKRPSVCWRATGKAHRQEKLARSGRAPGQQVRPLRRDQMRGSALARRHQLPASEAPQVSAIRCLPWQPARHSRKSPLPARELAQTMSVPLLLGTNGPAASKCATGCSTPRNRPRGCNALGFDSGNTKKKAKSDRREVSHHRPVGRHAHSRIFKLPKQQRRIERELNVKRVTSYMIAVKYPETPSPLIPGSTGSKHE